MKNIIKTTALTGLLAIVTGCGIQSKKEEPQITSLSYAVHIEGEYDAKIINTYRYLPGKLQKFKSDIIIESRDGTNITGRLHYIGKFGEIYRGGSWECLNWRLLESSGKLHDEDSQRLDYLSNESNHLTGPM